MFSILSKYWIITLLIIILLFQNCTKKKTSDEICYQILEIDKKYGFKIGEDEYILLDNLIETAQSKIQTQKNYSKEEAIKILNEIAEIHKEFGIKTPLRRSGLPFSIALKEKSFDCGNYVTTYLSIAQKLKLPIHAVFAPKHIFLEWNDGKNHFYWETLYNISKPKEAYIREHFIPQSAIENGVYLNPVNKVKLIADYNITVASYFLFIKNDVKKSYECITVRIQERLN